MGGCAAANCYNSNRKGFRMHQFPADPHRRLKWTISCRRSGWTPGPRAELCHVHFEDSQYEQNRADNLKRLKPNAVPTLFESAKSPHAPAVFTFRGVKGKGSVTMNPVLHSSPLDRTEVSNDELLLRICELEEELVALKLENADLKAVNEKLKTDIEANKNDLSFLSKEQLYVANKKLLKHAWSSESIIKGLKLRFALGKFGYKFLLSTGYPAPSYSTLKRNIRGIPMEFGVLHGILDSLKTKVDAMDANDRACAIFIDEMEIDATSDFDTTTQSFVGNITLGDQENKSGNHYTVVMIRGLKSPWKQVVAHEITGPSCSGPKMRELLSSTIEAVRGIGLNVKASVSDMGSNNKSLWRSLGVSVTKKERKNTYTIGSDASTIYSVADVPHLLKNMRSALLSKEIYISEEICSGEALPTHVVTSTHIKNLWDSEIKSDTGLRSLHHLNREHLYPSHFMLMNVGSAVRLFSINTAAALEKAAHLQQLPKEALTTAWFIRLINEWFSLMTARHPVKGITVKNQAEKFQFLEDFVFVLQHLKIAKGGWKPLQTGMIMSSLSVMQLAKEMFSAGYKFFLPGRLSQDALENIFSQIRKKSSSKPTALKARSTLKLICASQFMSDMENTNYSSDSDFHLLEFARKKLNLPKVTVESKMPSEKIIPTIAEENDIFFIAGATVNAILKTKLCSNCREAVTEAVNEDNPQIPENTMILNSYSNMGGLKVATSGIYKICYETENHFLMQKENFVKFQIPITDPFVSEIKEKCTNVPMPECCNIKEKIIMHYLSVRCKSTKNHINNKKKLMTVYSSFSMSKK